VKSEPDSADQPVPTQAGNQRSGKGVDIREHSVLRYVMRPLSAVLALAYGLSFLAICLVGCLDTAPAEHGCCSGEQGLSAAGAQKDCCTVVPGLSGKCFNPEVFPLSASSIAREMALMTSLPHRPARPPATADPPLILRI